MLAVTDDSYQNHDQIAQSVRESERSLNGNQWSCVQIPLRPNVYSYFKELNSWPNSSVS